MDNERYWDILRDIKRKRVIFRDIKRYREILRDIERYWEILRDIEIYWEILRDIERYGEILRDIELHWEFLINYKTDTHENWNKMFSKLCNLFAPLHPCIASRNFSDMHCTNLLALSFFLKYDMLSLSFFSYASFSRV